MTAAEIIVTGIGLALVGAAAVQLIVIAWHGD
jgi:hypothetical protein